MDDPLLERIVEADADGKTLNDLHVIAGGVLRRQHAGAGAGDGRHAFNGTVESVMQSVHIDADMLARVHAGQLRLLEVGSDP